MIDRPSTPSPLAFRKLLYVVKVIWTTTDSSVAKRRYASPESDGDQSSDGVKDTTNQNHWEKVERETGIEPATLSLGTFLLGAA